MYHTVPKYFSRAVIPNLIYLFFLNLISPGYSYAAFCSNNKDFTCLSDIYGRVLGFVLAGAIIYFFFMVISGGLKWLTSGGDPKDIENAKGRITFALLGLIIMIGCWFILKFLADFTVPDITKFEVPGP